MARHSSRTYPEDEAVDKDKQKISDGWRWLYQGVWSEDEFPDGPQSENPLAESMAVAECLLDGHFYSICVTVISKEIIPGDCLGVRYTMERGTAKEERGKKQSVAFLDTHD